MNFSRCFYRFLSSAFCLLSLSLLLPTAVLAETPSNTFYQTPNKIKVEFVLIGIVNSNYDNYTLVNNLDGTEGYLYLSDLAENHLYMGNQGILTSISNSDINGFTEHGFPCHFSLGENLIVTQDARYNTTTRSVSVEYRVSVVEGNTSLYYRRYNTVILVISLSAFLIALLVYQIFKSVRVDKND